jgi:hypothetical protein
MQPLCWPNTVQLTLSIQRPSELMLLLQCNALPAIEHLNVTNEELHTALPLGVSKSVPYIRLSEHGLREGADGTRLRFLLLRYITLSDVIILIGSLTMPLLEKLILVDMYDHSKLSLDISSSIIVTLLSAIIQFHFVL